MKHFKIFIIFLCVFVISGCGATNIISSNYGSYYIDQTDTDTAAIDVVQLQIPGLTDLSLEAEVKVVSKGEPLQAPSAGAKYGYLTKWRLNYSYSEKWEPFSLDWMQFGICTFTGQNIKCSGDIVFDLSTADKDGKFKATYENSKSGGDKVTMTCSKANLGPIETDPFSYSHDTSMPLDGVIYDLTENGAKLKFPDTMIYDAALHKIVTNPVIVYIKKK